MACKSSHLIIKDNYFEFICGFCPSWDDSLTKGRARDNETTWGSVRHPCEARACHVPLHHGSGNAGCPL